MLGDYELFLSGCYGAVVEVKYDDDVYKFMDLMEDLGFKTYVNWLRKIDEKCGILDNARHNGIKHLCFEYQMGKGFTYGEKQEYIDNCEETKILSLEDLIKSVGKEKDFFLDYKEVDLVKMSGDSNLEILNDFCNMYDWLPVQCEKGFNIKDMEFENEFVEKECYKTFTELVNRIVVKAIDYFRENSMYIDENDKENSKDCGYELLNIIKSYRNYNDKYEEKWIYDFEEELKKV